MTLTPDTMTGLLSFAVILLVLVSGRFADRLAILEERVNRWLPDDCDCASCREGNGSLPHSED